MDIKNLKIENVSDFVFDKNITEYVVNTNDNKRLINGELEEIYLQMFKEMSQGFDIIVVKDDKELEIAK